MTLSHEKFDLITTNFMHFNPISHLWIWASPNIYLYDRNQIAKHLQRFTKFHKDIYSRFQEWLILEKFGKKILCKLADFFILLGVKELRRERENNYKITKLESFVKLII